MVRRTRHQPPPEDEEPTSTPGPVSGGCNVNLRLASQMPSVIEVQKSPSEGLGQRKMADEPTSTPGPVSGGRSVNLRSASRAPSVIEVQKSPLEGLGQWKMANETTNTPGPVFGGPIRGSGLASRSPSVVEVYRSPSEGPGYCKHKNADPMGGALEALKRSVELLDATLKHYLPGNIDPDDASVKQIVSAPLATKDGGGGSRSAVKSGEKAGDAHLDGSMMNGLQSLTQWEDSFNNPTSSRLGLLNAIQRIGSLDAYPFAPYMSDDTAHQLTVLFGAIIMCGATVLHTASRTVNMFIGGRFTIGFGLTFAANAEPMFVFEIGPHLLWPLSWPVPARIPWPPLPIEALICFILPLAPLA